MLGEGGCPLRHTAAGATRKRATQINRSILLAFTLVIRPTSALRILALHGGGQSSSSFEGALTSLTATLGAGHTFVYASAPSSGNLWYADPPGGKTQPTTDPNWSSAAFAVLDGLVSSQGPFDGIIGYSQGAAMTILYLSTHSATSTFRFAVTFCGCARRPATRSPALLFVRLLTVRVQPCVIMQTSPRITTASSVVSTRLRRWQLRICSTCPSMIGSSHPQ